MQLARSKEWLKHTTPSIKNQTDWYKMALYGMACKSIEALGDIKPLEKKNRSILPKLNKIWKWSSCNKEQLKMKENNEASLTAVSSLRVWYQMFNLVLVSTSVTSLVCNLSLFVKAIAGNGYL